jgi:membrane protease YdiL (CAAX protease family)
MITIMCILLGIIFGWLRLASGSLIPPIICHAALNAQLLAYFPSFVVTDVNPVLGGGTGVIGLGIMAIVTLWLYLTRRIR